MSANNKPLTWTENRVFVSLEKVFKRPEYLLLQSVRNKTGYPKTVRTADAVAVSVWPSRGLYFAGVEIKVSRSDWRAELAQPEKSAEIQRFCRYWYVAAPAGVVPPEELPPTWGLIECNETRARIVKRGPELPAVPPDVGFVCSMLRTVVDRYVPRSTIAEQIEAARAEGYERGKKFISPAAGNHERAAKELRERIARFEEASGIQIGETWTARHVGEDFKTFRESGYQLCMEYLRQTRAAAEEIQRLADRYLSGRQAETAVESKR